MLFKYGNEEGSHFSKEMTPISFEKKNPVFFDVKKRAISPIPLFQI
jgi:hypothetical protein